MVLRERSLGSAASALSTCVYAIEQTHHGDDVASMAWNLHAIEQAQLRRQYRFDGVGRLKFDFHTASRLGSPLAA